MNTVEQDLDLIDAKITALEEKLDVLYEQREDIIARCEHDGATHVINVGEFPYPSYITVCSICNSALEVKN